MACKLEIGIDILISLPARKYVFQTCPMIPMTNILNKPVVISWYGH